MGLLGGGSPSPPRSLGPPKDSHSEALKGDSGTPREQRFLSPPYLCSIVLNPGQFIGSQGAFQRAVGDHFFPLQDEA